MADDFEGYADIFFLLFACSNVVRRMRRCMMKFLWARNFQSGELERCVLGTYEVNDVDKRNYNLRFFLLQWRCT